MCFTPPPLPRPAHPRPCREREARSAVFLSRCVGPADDRAVPALADDRRSRVAVPSAASEAAWRDEAGGARAATLSSRRALASSRAGRDRQQPHPQRLLRAPGVI